MTAPKNHTLNCNIKFKPTHGRQTFCCPEHQVEDNDDNLFQMLDNFDKLINNQPDLVLKPDPKLIELADNLVEGVEVN
jgi:hypothetical protein